MSTTTALQAPDYPRSQQRRNEVLLAQADVAGRALPKREIMQRVCSRALDAIDARLVAIARPHRMELVYEIAAGAAPDAPVRVHMDTSLTGLCYRNRESFLSADVSKDSRSSLVATHKFSGRSLILVPIPGAPEPLGVLMATSDRPGVFDEGDLHTMEMFAGIISTEVSAASASEERQLLVAERAAALDQLEFQAKLMQSVQQAVVAIDLEGLVTYWSPFAEKLYGWTADEVMGKYLQQFMVSPEMDVRAAEVMALLHSGKSWTGEFELLRKNGTRFHASVTDSPIFDSAGRVTGFVGVSSDVSERRELETQLRQAQKMEAVGQLAGGVAHDFNNILTAIIGYSEFALLKLPEGETRADVIEVRQAAERAADLTKQLLTFSRKQVIRVETVDLTDIIRGLDKMLRRMINESITLDTTLSEGPVFVEADRSQIEQLVINLVVNARDAMPDGGRLTVGATVQVGEDGAPVARMRVIDSGCGMTDDVKRHIFEPFFTTKPEGRGTGLGLAVVFGVVQQLGGAIKVDSAPGQGTTFTITLPVSEHAPECPDNCTVALPRGSETVLLVEDNEPLSVMTGRVLQSLGYCVIRAANGGVAARLPDETLRRVDLLLTDVVMPEMNGPALVRELRARKLRPRVLYMSGYTQGADLGDLDLRTVSFIPKPWTSRELATEIRRVLDARKVAA